MIINQQIDNVTVCVGKCLFGICHELLFKGIYDIAIYKYWILKF